MSEIFQFYVIKSSVSSDTNWTDIELQESAQQFGFDANW